MAINFSVPQSGDELKPRIVVFGVGGAGGNAVNNMISSQLEGVEFVVANTDAQALANSLAERRVQLGQQVTGGLGAGARPEVGRAAAEETYEQVVEHLRSAHMAFIAAGMGGGTGTGAAPVIARAAKDLGILTVGVVTKPFQFEGTRRQRTADEGITDLQQFVDTLIVIPNQNLFRVANEKTTFTEAFRMADNVLHSGVRGITDLMVMPGLINLDFADVRSVMSEMGKAMMGTGEAEGDNRALEAAERAIANPLLDDISMKGARGVLINITGGLDLTLYEVDEAANRIRNEVDPEANIIVGSTLDETLKGRMRVTVVATGIDAQLMERPKPDTGTAASTITPFRAPQRPAAPVAPVASVATPVVASAAAVAVQPMPAPEPVVAVAPAAPIVEPAATVAPVPLAEAVPAAEAIAAIEPVAAVAPAPAQQVLQQPGVLRPDPFREADLVNGGVGSKARSRFSQKIFGFGFGPTAANPATVAPARAEPTVRPANLSTPAQVAPIAPVAPAGAAPRLGLEASDRPAVASSEDILQIPAFLRRQAN